MSAEVQAADAPVCDAVTLEVIRGALRASQSEMEALIERTAMSAFIREKKDFFVALFDATGDMIVGAYRPEFRRSGPTDLRVLSARSNEAWRSLLV